MKPFRYSAILLIFALVLSACSTGPNPNQTPPAAGPDQGEQSPITLDSEFLEVADSMPEFAGMYYDDNGELTVAVAASGISTQALEAQRVNVTKAITKIFGEEVLFVQPDLTKVEALQKGDLSLQGLAAPTQALGLVPVKYSFGQLMTWREQVAETAWKLDGVNTLDVDEVNNKILVGVEDQATAASLEAQLAALGLPEDALVVEVDAAANPGATLGDRARSLVGGLGIVGQGGGRSWGCTYGFNVIRYGVAGFVTNAHCTSNQGTVNSDRFYQGGSLVGYEAAEAPMWTSGSYRYRWADVAFARFNGSQTQTLGGIARTNLNQRDVTGTLNISYKSNPLAGESVYKVGNTTGTTYGRIVRTCTDSRANGTNIVNKCQSQAQSGQSSDITVAGDSGSPVYRYRYVRNAGWKIELKGINWTGKNGSGYNSMMTFSPIANIQYSLGTLRVHPTQKTGDKLKVTLRYVKVHNDCEPWHKGDGDMYGYFDIEGSRVFTLSETDVASGETISINRYRTVDGRYDNPISIRGVLKDADDTDPDDWIGNWNLNLDPVPSVGYFSNYSRPDCDATLYYRIEDVGNTYE